jgi:hypothetical protein
MIAGISTIAESKTDTNFNKQADLSTTATKNLLMKPIQVTMKEYTQSVQLKNLAIEFQSVQLRAKCTEI